MFLEDSSGHRADEDDAELPRERDARAWITAILDSLRWNGRKLGHDESFCYVAQLTGEAFLDLVVVLFRALFEQFDIVPMPRRLS